MKNYIFIIFCLISSILLAQKQKRDTLFIKYDNSLLNRRHDSIEKRTFYLIKGTGVTDSELVYLEEKKIYKNLNPRKTVCFKNVLKNSNAYYGENKLYDSKLAEYLGKYVLFFIREKKYIKVLVVQEIE